MPSSNFAYMPRPLILARRITFGRTILPIKPSSQLILRGCFYSDCSQQDTPNRKEKVAARKKASLRRAALEATASRRVDADLPKPDGHITHEKVVAAYCFAAQFDLNRVHDFLERAGFVIDPCHTALSQQVIHVEVPVSEAVETWKRPPDSNNATGDVFIFPSGNIVAWNVPEANILRLMKDDLWYAGVGHHRPEDEDFEYIEDSSRERSTIQKETIILGTKRPAENFDAEQGPQRPLSTDSRRHVNTILAKIAFSSGLARSTKLAVLESSLETYLEGTKSIPEKLMNGNLGSYSREFIYLKMGQLLDLRRQLNLSSDLTDSLPDVFWDAEADLGLENYYDRMSKALDTQQRIKSLNEKMDYAHEIASILREELSVIREQQSERHSTRLEWIIIILITVEVAFGTFDLLRKLKEDKVREGQIEAST